MSGKRRLILLLAVLVIQTGNNAAIAQTVTDPKPTLRRIFVPQDGIETEARSMWPVKRAEFEKRWAALQAVARSDQGPPAASIASGVYRASLRGDTLVDGTAELQIARQTAAENNPASVWLTLAPCNMAVSSPTWKPTGDRPQAESVTWGHRESGELLVAVPRSNGLQFGWSLRGRRDERGSLSFDVAVPAGPQQRLVLAIPATWKLVSDSALIREVATPKPTKANDPPTDVEWIAEVPLSGRMELRLEPRQREGELQPLVLFRETSSFVFSPGQLDLELSLELDIDRAPLRTIRVSYDPRLEWSVIRWGEQSLTWATEESASGTLVAVITLPEPLVGNSRLIHLTGAADWSAGTQKWVLPRATVEGAIWQEGRINVASPRWLQLDGQAGAGSRLTATTLASDSQGADLLQFQLERSSAVVTVQAASTPAQLEATSLVSLQVEPKQLVAQVAAELASTSGSQFTVECEVARGWLLDSIDTVPADAIEDRLIRPRGNQQLLTLFLKHAVRSGKPLRLNARLRQVRSGSEEPWNDDVLQPLRFPLAAKHERYVTLQLADATAEPRLTNASGLEFIPATTLPAQVRSLSEAPLGNWLVRLTDAARHPRFVLAHGTPRYVAESTLQISLSPQQADYHLQVHCQPESSAVSRVLLQIRPAPAMDPQWFLAGDSRPLVVERLPPPAQSDQPAPALFRVELPGSRDTDFTVEARWSETIASNTAAPLTELPEATSHSSLVEIAGPLDAPVTWQAERLRPLPIPAGAAQLRARYRFQAGQDSRLTLLPLRESERSLVGWISRCDVSSEFAPSGAGRHEARFLLAGDEVAVLEVRLPEGARLARAVVDGRDVLAYSRTSDPQWLSIPISPPPGTRREGSPLVRVEYISPSATSRGWLSSRWTAPLLETRLPVLQGQWQARLPRGWRVWPDGEHSRTSASASSLSPLEIFGSESDSVHVARELTSATNLQIDVYSVPWLSLLAVACGLLAGGLAWQLQKWPATRLIAGALMLLALSLLLSEPWRLFLQAAMAGWLTGLVWLLLGQLARPNPAPATPHSTRLILQSAARLLLLAATLTSLLACPNMQSGQSLICAADGPAKKDAWRLVTPLDAQGRPTDVVYVSDALHTALFRSTDAPAAGQPDWLLRSAQYDVRWQAGETGGEFQGVVASLEVEVLHEPSILRLPLARDQVRISEPGVRIDGEPASASWTTAGDVLQIELTRVGRRNVEIGLALAEVPKDGLAGAQIRIPAIADSRVILPATTATDQIKISSARGAERQTAGAAWQVALGGANELRVQWSSKAADPLPVVEAEQLLVWRLRPHSVVVEGKWQFRALSGKLRAVVLRADPRYRLLPANGEQQFARQWTEEGDTNLHHFVLETPPSGDVTLAASFLLVGSTGVGNLNPPRLEPVADRLKRDWQAAWLAPAMQWTGKTGTLPIADFLQAWGDNAITPAQAFRATPEAPRPTLSAVASIPRLQAEQRIEWSLAPDLAAAELRLSGSLASPQVNQLHFQLPPQWVVRRVACVQPSGGAALRWFRHGDGMLTLLLDEVRAEPWQIEVSADRPQIPGKQTTLPVLVTSEMDLTRYECVIRRRSGAEIKLGKVPGWSALPLEDEDAVAGRERIVARFEWSNARPGTMPPAIPLTLDAAPQAVTGDLLTRLRPVDGGYEVDVIASLQSPGKSFDELQFSVPRDWTDSFELEPSGTTRIESLPGQSRNLLRVQLHQPVKDALRLRMTARLLEEPELIRVPVVDLVGQFPLRRWVALPAAGMDSRLQWQTSGLQSRPELPAGLVDAESEDESYYEATFERYRASARPARARLEKPRIVLADHQVAGLKDGRVVGRSDLTILPGGARSILIQPPESHELVAAVVNDIPAQLRREPGISGAATVELHSDAWPQWVQVIYRGRLPATDYSGGERQFAAPRVAGAPVERTRWHVISSEPLLDSLAHASRETSGEDDLLAPLEALAKIAKGATDAPSGNSAESSDLWFRLWRERWDREYATLRARPATSPLAPILTARLRALETDMADLLTLPLDETPAVLPADKLDWEPDSDAVLTHPQYELRHTEPGELHTLTVALPPASHREPERWNWLIAVALLASAGALTQIGRVGALRDWIAAYPQLALALAGCAMLLVPGYLWLGGVLMALSLLATLHAPWRR